MCLGRIGLVPASSSVTIPGGSRHRGCCALEVPTEKNPDELSYLAGVCLEREVPGVEQMNFGIRQVAFVGLGASRDERRIVLAPNRE